ncbi:hypothetical protein [Thermococcus gorgonarius]|uniref:Uncharacterized protein n=1 Tax=Thermococcus gorgonarius TaxID=71997 RepID=A0A2Z2M509_THEGO|nr:hypothetical protein [Thermococcus gorgonarius]ASJ00069.1 hypothetical protein A3K92_00500 [Thermococcus gorgonarius]
MKLEKITLRNELFWKAGVAYLVLSVILLVVEVMRRGTLFSLLNVFVGVVFIVMANRFRAVKLECDGKTFFIIPDYATSSVILKDSGEQVLLKRPFPIFETEEIETPCGMVKIQAINHRFGKIELIIWKENKKITLP